MKIVICDDSEFEIEALKKLCEEYISDRYTEIETIIGQKIKGIPKSMKTWEEELAPYGFMRISDDRIINCRYVKGFEGDCVVIKDIGAKLRVSRRKKQDCIKFFRAYRLKSSKYI